MQKRGTEKRKAAKRGRIEPKAPKVARVRLKDLKPAALAAEEIIESQKKAAKYVGRSERTIRRWVKEGMPTAKVNGKTAYVKSMLDYFKASEGKQVTEDRKREQTAQADLKQIKAKLLEMDLKIREGKLIEREEIEKQWVQRIQIVKRGFLGMGRKLAPQLAKLKDPRKVQEIIDKEARQIILKFTKR